MPRFRAGKEASGLAQGSSGSPPLTSSTRYCSWDGHSAMASRTRSHSREIASIELSTGSIMAGNYQGEGQEREGAESGMSQPLLSESQKRAAKEPWRSSSPTPAQLRRLQEAGQPLPRICSLLWAGSFLTASASTVKHSRGRGRAEPGRAFLQHKAGCHLRPVRDGPAPLPSPQALEACSPVHPE